MSSRLTSWKEIAEYLGKGVRTVQRYEQLGLPVRRPDAKKCGIVIALTDEIDAWLSETWAFRDNLESKTPEVSSELAVVQHHLAEHGRRVQEGNRLLTETQMLTASLRSRLSELQEALVKFRELQAAVASEPVATLSQAAD